MTIVIHSRRGALLFRAILQLGAVGAAGWLLQSWSPLRTSLLGRVGDALGVPGVACVVWALGFAWAVTLLLDHWSFRLELFEDRMVISERLGETTIAYDGIERVGRSPVGPGIALKDRERWLATYRGTPSSLAKVRRMSAYLKGACGYDVCVKPIRLDVGVDRFLELVSARVAAPAPERANDVA